MGTKYFLNYKFIINKQFTFFVDREHSSWPELKEVLKYQDWEEHTPLLTTEFLPKNITSCTVYGFSCTSQPVIFKYFANYWITFKL